MWYKSALYKLYGDRIVMQMKIGFLFKKSWWGNISFDDMHNISRSQQFMIKIATMEWFGWWCGVGGLFSLKRLIYFHYYVDIVGQVKLSLSFCFRLIIFFTRFSVLLYDMLAPNIYRILSKDYQVIYTLDTIHHDTSSRASPDILFNSNSFEIQCWQV